MLHSGVGELCITGRLLAVLQACTAPARLATCVSIEPSG
jgi:hypothetical protein